MNKKLYLAMFALTSVLLIGNICTVVLVNGDQITYDEIHYGYFDDPVNVLYWGGDGTEGSVFSTTDINGYLTITCYSTSFSASEDVYVAKFDPNMKQLWNTSWSASDDARPCGIAIDNSNNVYVAGTVVTTLPGPDFVHNVFLMKLNATGYLLWTEIHETINLEETALSMTLDNSSSFVYIAGSTNSTNGDLFVQKYSKVGTYIDTFNYGTTAPREAMEIGGMTIDINDDLFISATTDNTPVGNLQDLVLIKMNSTSGIAYWNTTFGYTTPNDKGVDIEVSNDCAYLLGHIISPTPSDLDAVVVKLNATTGTIIWNSVVDFGNEITAGLSLNRHGNPVIAGTTNALSIPYDYFVAEFNQTGHLLWNTTYSTEGADSGGDIVCDEDFAFVVGNSYNTTEGSDNVIIIVYEDNSEFDFPVTGPYGKIFGIMFGVIIGVLALVFIAGIVYTYYKK